MLLLLTFPRIRTRSTVSEGNRRREERGMPLVIFNNGSTFDRERAHFLMGHLGTRDRDNPANRFDFPGKASKLLQAANELREYVATSHESTVPGRHRDELPLKPLTILGSSRYAEESELIKIHPTEYLEDLKKTAEESRGRVARGADPYIHFGKEADVTPGTYDAARHSVGTAFDAIDVALQSEGTTTFALVWPPGHHAEPDQAMGFCYLSTAALAAAYARDHQVQVRPGHPNRVVVIDIDHHRGNGTAKSIMGKEDLFLVDMVYRSPYDEVNHRYLDGAREYPYTRDDASLGIMRHPVYAAPNIFPLEFEGFQSSATVLDAFVSKVLPFVRSIQPDVVLWSLGLDAARGDPLGGLGLVPSAYYTMIKGMRLAFPHARHCGVLEGGYDQRLSGRCLKPSLMALHDELSHARSRLFVRYRDAFLR
jgi:acetoin utilization deacetylase AcuC-like enzyme